MAEPVVTTTERNWSEECRIADPEPEDETVYQFGKKKFVDSDPLYDVPQE